MREQQHRKDKVLKVHRFVQIEIELIRLGIRTKAILARQLLAEALQVCDEHDLPHIEQLELELYRELA